MTLLTLLQPFLSIAVGRARERFDDDSGISIVGTVIALVILALIVVVAVIEWLVPND